MRLTRFEVQGFKNFRQPVVLEGLDGFDVIHGENNVGKSNLLQAIDLFFWLFSQIADDQESRTVALNEASKTPWSFTAVSQAMTARGFDPDAVFNLESPMPITLAADFQITSQDWQRTGREVADSAIHVELSLTRPLAGAAAVWMTPLLVDRALTLNGLSRLMSRAFNVRGQADAHAFILVDTHRRVAELDGQCFNQELRSTVPHALLLALYDAKESVEPGLFRRWELFERAMNSLGPVVGEGRFVITFNRREGRAILALQRGSLRVPIEALGSGVQQIASLLARVLVANSAIVAVEEPELNLRYEMQLRLRDMLRDIVASGEGPQQIIVTSHSPAFEEGPTFYAMRATEAGPVVERRPVSEAPAFLQLADIQPPPSGGAAYGYVSSEGLLRLSDETREQLGVTNGGGVVVLKRPESGFVEILSNEQFMRLLHGDGEAS